MILPGGISQCSSSKDNSGSIFARKTNLLYEIPIAQYQRRRRNITRDESTMFLERENKENVCKRLERPCTELESATQSTISDSTENRFVKDYWLKDFCVYLVFSYLVHFSQLVKMILPSFFLSTNLFKISPAIFYIGKVLTFNTNLESRILLYQKILPTYVSCAIFSVSRNRV